MAAFDLTGFWLGDDDGFYYLRQEDNGTLWWVGLSNDPDQELNSPQGLQFGLTFSNVFKGQVGDSIIEGVWVDVPRGESLNNGTLSLKITTADDGITTQLQLQKIASSDVGFGASLWTQVDLVASVDRGIQDVFHSVIKGYGPNPLADDLKRIFKDSAVVFGWITSDPAAHIAWEASSSTNYGDFICSDGGGSRDGDLNIDIRVDAMQLESPFRQTNFWTDGWVGDPGVLRSKLAFPGPGGTPENHLHLEMTMFGRTAACGDTQNYNNAPLLPGWEEKNGNSILLNGRPISGQVLIGPTDVGDAKEVLSIRDQLIDNGGGFEYGMYVRVTGCLVLDCGHYRYGDPFDPCGDAEPDFQVQEMHPLYAIDIINLTSSDDLSGTWSDDDGRTYYIHQLLGDNTIWGLGMSPFRDHTFARVFQGTILQNQTIIGNWADVPLGQGQNTGTLTLRIEPGKMHLFADSSDSLVEQRWTKLYHAFPPPFNIVSALSGKFLDVPGGSLADNVLIQQFHDNGGGANQQWRILPVGKEQGPFNIISMVSGKFLDVPGASMADNVPIQQFHDNGGGANQQWQIVPVGEGQGLVNIVSQLSGKFLDVPGGSLADNVLIQQFHDNGGGANQLWQLYGVGDQVITQTFNIVSAASGKFLDVPGGSLADNVLIQQFHDNGGGANQQWRVVTLGNGLVNIISMVSRKFLDVPGGSLADNVPIQQFQFTGGANQQWQLVPVGEGLVNIVSQVSGKFLDVPGASMDDNIIIQQFHDNGGGANQQWQLVPVGN